MGTIGTKLLSESLFGPARRAILALLYGHSDEAFYLRQITRAAGVGHGVVQREVAQLTSSGILVRSVRGRQVYFQANPQCPIFLELRSLVVKTAVLKAPKIMLIGEKNDFAQFETEALPRQVAEGSPPGYGGVTP